MSYVISIWKQPEDLPWPGSLKEAVEQLRLLFKRPGPPDAACQRLLERLARRYPDFAEDDEEGEGPWLEGLQDVLPSDVPVFNFGLMSGDHLDAAQACVVSEAVALGLNVFDDQAGELHLGHGVSLGLDDRAACVTALDALALRDHALAASRLQPALRQGNRMARELLADLYLRGQGVRQDQAAAAALGLSALAWKTGEDRRLRPADEASQAKVRQWRQAVGEASFALASAWMARLLPPPAGQAARHDPADVLAQAAADLDQRLQALEQRIRQTPGLAPWDDMHALAQRGHPTAQYLASLMLTEGRGVAADPAQALQWLRRAARAGHPLGLYNLAWHHEQGQDLPQDLQAARRLYGLSARAGCAPALAALRNLEQRLADAPVDPGGLRQAAEAGDAAAQLRLGEALLDGAPGLPRDPALGHDWVLRAARQGLAEAQHIMGSLCLKGEGRPADLQGAVYWWGLAAAQGHADALCNMGLAHYRGEGTAVNRPQARQCFLRAAQGGNAAALHNLGILARQGHLGGPPDPVLGGALQLAAGQRGHRGPAPPLPPESLQEAQRLAADLAPDTDVVAWLERRLGRAPGGAGATGPGPAAAPAPAASAPRSRVPAGSADGNAPDPTDPDPAARPAAKGRDGLTRALLALGCFGLLGLLLLQPPTWAFRVGAVGVTVAAALGGWRVASHRGRAAQLLCAVVCALPGLGLLICAMALLRTLRPGGDDPA
ncbi:tetratricopeptide repeat protein [Ideonella livida]|uniref:Sel1 repeat family protein n=1 Tax=Ideonella livida TaxID=2707176 RepID=A0A7C9TNX3_9BURK|nr:tetratricopeptide repeat protein [Ideonella livida]NDY93767.1 sel1 repeat family protein [Ideonella livida]